MSVMTATQWVPGSRTKTTAAPSPVIADQAAREALDGMRESINAVAKRLTPAGKRQFRKQLVVAFMSEDPEQALRVLQTWHRTMLLRRNPKYKLAAKPPPLSDELLSSKELKDRLNIGS